jgi:signal transduction histidine kinase
MPLAAALIYWVIVFLWLTVLGTLLVFYIRNRSVFGTTRLLLTVLAIDTTRNIIENTYFGIYFGGEYGIFPSAVVPVLGNPTLLIVPKIINVAAGCVVLGLLLMRWLPSAIRERSELEKSADDARGLASLMDEFVANVSHELRTPITSIAGSLGLLTGGVAGQLPAKAVRLISIAHINTQRLARLINDILDIGRIEAAKMIFVFAPTDLCTTAEQAIDANRAFAEQHGVSLRLHMEAPSCLVRADVDRLIQVLTNLLSNAIKFSPSGEEVIVTVEQRGCVGSLMVRDHGPGIPEEFKSRIFGKFAQAKGDGLQPKGGSGLGLNIAAKIVGLHDGSIGFREAMGGGTIFYFEIPLWEADAAEFSVLPDAQPRAAIFGDRERLNAAAIE